MSSNLLIEESPLVLLPSLAKTVGLNEALFLQQVHYWLQPKYNKNLHDGRLWVHNTYSQWQIQFPFWGEKTIRRTIVNLEKMSVIESRVTTNNFRKTKFYTINYDVLNEINSSDNLREDRSGHIDQSHLPKRADGVFCGLQDDFSDKTTVSNKNIGIIDEQKRNKKKIKTPKTAENCGFVPSGQCDHTGLPKWADRYGQNDHIDLVNVTSSYKEAETTTETTLPLPDLSPTHEIKNDDEENKLIQIWNDVVQSQMNGRLIRLTKVRLENISTVYRVYFSASIEQWISYCEQISQSQFLMGNNKSGFRAHFDWATKPENITKILEGAIYDKPAVSKSVAVSSESFVKNVEATTSCQRWRKIVFNFAEATSIAACAAWFNKIQPGSLDEKVVVFKADSAFTASHMSQKYENQMLLAVRKTCSHVESINFEYGERAQ